MKIRNRKRWGLLLTIILLFTCASMAQAKIVTSKVSGQIDYTESYRFLNLLNKLRKSKGLNPVKMDKALLASAEQRAAENAILYSHTRPNGKSCSSASPYIKAENIAIANSAANVYTVWKNSPGHYRNMISPQWSSVGICAIVANGQMYWVNVFGTKPAQNVKKNGSAKKTYKVQINTGYLKSGNIFFEGPCTMQSESTNRIKIVLYLKKLSDRVSTLPQTLFRYESSNPSVATVSADGTVTTYEEGKTVLTATLKSNPSIRKKLTLNVDDSFWPFDEGYDD